VKKYNNYIFKIFGSRARGDFKNYSDIDIAVIGKVSKEDKFKILNEFDVLDLPYTVDIVFTENIQKIELLNSIEKEGVEI
jgi:predicted nucleotidyltransferase